jgi:hypothetical protein
VIAGEAEDAAASKAFPCAAQRQIASLKTVLGEQGSGVVGLSSLRPIYSIGKPVLSDKFGNLIEAA